MMLTITVYLLIGVAFRLARQSACWMSTSLSGRVCAYVLIIVPAVVLGLLMQAIVHGSY